VPAQGAGEGRNGAAQSGGFSLHAGLDIQSGHRAKFGTTHIVLVPLDLMARLAALVPSPRMHLIRYQGVFAPHSRLRAAVTPEEERVGNQVERSTCGGCTAAGREPCGRCQDRWR
jgi:hypothetical protein